jgi:hypothetical protein
VRGGHGLPKVSLVPVLPNPCGRATPETALQPFQGWPTCRVGGLQPSSTLWTPRVVRLWILLLRPEGMLICQQREILARWMKERGRLAAVRRRHHVPRFVRREAKVDYLIDYFMSNKVRPTCRRLSSSYLVGQEGYSHPHGIEIEVTVRP